MIAYCRLCHVYEGYLKRQSTPLVDDVALTRQQAPQSALSSGKVSAQGRCVTRKETRGTQGPSMEPSSTPPDDRKTPPTLADERDGSSRCIEKKQRKKNNNKQNLTARPPTARGASAAAAASPSRRVAAGKPQEAIGATLATTAAGDPTRRPASPARRANLN